ncbi:hypothetical protein [Bacillus massilioanorexius]|uniref:hypothetical protein n=1 Tax=Bacillus massilioanorexius TaxID=1468413 RepID=UPI0002F7DCDC|nr:hypothetical protein [Bacillus massilioanorexius]
MSQKESYWEHPFSYIPILSLMKDKKREELFTKKDLSFLVDKARPAYKGRLKRKVNILKQNPTLLI